MFSIWSALQKWKTGKGGRRKSFSVPKRQLLRIQAGLRRAAEPLAKYWPFLSPAGSPGCAGGRSIAAGPRIFSTGLCLFLFTLLQGCATGTLSAGSALATAGQTAANQMSQNVTISNSTVQQVRLALAFTDGYNGMPNASAPVITQITNLVSNLAAYSQLLNHLSSAYAALGSLAADNSASSFNTAANGLASSVNAFAKSVGSSTAPLPTNLPAIVDAVGDQILSNYQADHVRQASDALLVQLNQVITILNEVGVRDKVVPSTGLVVGNIDVAAGILYASGAYSYGPLANELGQPLGLTATSSIDSLIAKNSKLKAGFNNVEVEAANNQIAAIGASYDSSEKLLEALRPLHAAVDKGTPIDSATIISIVGQLQNLATQIQPPKASSKAE